MEACRTQAGSEGAGIEGQLAPTLTVVAGPNGSGKSTLTRLGRETFQETAVLDPDAVARSMLLSGSTSGSPMDAGRAVLRMADVLLQSKQSFLVETTLSGNTYLRMMKEAKRQGYLVVLLFVGTEDVAINMKRVANRVAKGGHDVPVEDQLRRYPRSMENFRRAFALADEASVFDNSTSLGHVLIAVKSADGIEFFSEVPEWAAFLQANE
jgi:predicted ABC-type ATPase